MNPVRIAIVGAGGLGVAAAWGIAQAAQSAPARTIRLLDADTVQTSNLHRQVLFTEADLGQPKVTILAERLKQRTGFLSWECIPNALSPENCFELLADVDVVLDATDDVPTKWFLNDYCRLEGLPFCYAGAVGVAGQVLAIAAGSNPTIGGCLRCLFGDLTVEECDGLGSSCRAQGILGPAVGAVGFALGGEALRLAAEHGAGARQNTHDSRLLRFDLEQLRWTESYIPAARHCPLGCGFRRTQRLDLTSKECPQTFLFTKLAAEQLPDDALLHVLFSAASSVENVSRSMIEEGYRVIGEPRQTAPKRWHLLLARSGADQ